MKQISFFLCLFAGIILNGNSFGQAGPVYTVAGGGSSLAEGVPATSANLANVTGVATDLSGNIYVTDNGHYKIRKVDRASGLIYTVAGNGTYGSSGDGGLATNAQIGVHRAIYVDNLDNIFIAEQGGKIRKVNAITGIISLVAGGGSSTAEGVPATSANLGEQLSVFVDQTGNVFCSGINKVRRVDATTGLITTVAGGGSSTADGVPATTASISSGVKSISLDEAGNIYIISHDGSPVRRVDGSSGLIYTIAGGGSSSADGIPATASSLSDAHSCKVDAAGNLFIADWNRNIIRRVESTTGIINTIAGNGTRSSSTEGLPALSSTVAPYQVCLDPIFGNIYYTDFDTKVRRFTYSPIYAFSGTGITTGSDSFTVTVNKTCSGPQLTVRTVHYYAGMTVKTWFGDGDSSTHTISRAYSGIGGYAVLAHTYSNSGVYSIKQVLYNGTSVVDSFDLTYDYNYCATMPVKYYLDGNGNCTKDGGESYNFQAIKTEIDSNGVPVDTVIATSGFYYTTYGRPGDIYTFKILTLPTGYHTSCPSTGVIYDTLRSGTYHEKINYFGLSCGTSTDYDFAVNAVIPVTGNRDQWGNIYVRNTSCYPTDADVTLHFSPKYIYTSGFPRPPATSHTDNSITWHVTGLSADVPAPVNLYYAVFYNPATGLVPIRDTVNSYITITPTIGDVDTSNNDWIKTDTVRAGYDPNEIIVRPEGCLPWGGTPTKMEYSVHFENTGNDTAHNIYVMDTISDYLDPSTLEIVTASAEMYLTKIRYGAGHYALKFDFPNIKLLDSSHHGQADGAVIYTIKTKPGLPAGTVINNYAGIFFDYNPVVLTNNAKTDIGCPETLPVAETSAPSASIYPNPGTNSITIATTPAAYSAYTLHNAMGQEIIANTINTPATNIDVKGLPAGVYTITLKGAAGAKVEKWVKW